VLRWQVPSTAVPFDHRATIRVDSGVSEGDTVGTNYGEIGGGGQGTGGREGREGGMEGLVRKTGEKQLQDATQFLARPQLADIHVILVSDA